MQQILLRSNRRIGTLALISAALVVLLAIVVVYFASLPWLRWLAVLVAVLSVLALVLAFWFRQFPRMAIVGEELLIHARALRSPIRVPLEYVEVFFLGQGAVQGAEPGHPPDYQGAVAANVVVRLAEKDKSWHQRSVNQWLAVWEDGYITLRGLWCENIDQHLMKDMNASLVQAKRLLRQGASK